jgi:hypothetical protein
MPRLLSDRPCEVTFQDRISRSKITVQYRLPTEEERMTYANSLVKRVKGKIESNVGPARIKAGAAIILGFADGAFETDKGPLSSDPKSPHYDPDWKAFVRKYAPDVLVMLALHAFETSLVLDEPNPDDGEDGKEKDEDPS